MKRTGPLRAKSAKRHAVDAETKPLRDYVSRQPCLLQHTPTLMGPCSGVGTPHYLDKQGQGGATDPENLVPLCAFHNGEVENRPLVARMIGLVVRWDINHAEAARRRVQHRLW